MVSTSNERTVPVRIRQAIFSGTASADGARLMFASLADGRCALLREGELVAAWGCDVYGIDVGVRQFLVATERDNAAAVTTSAPLRSHARPHVRPYRKPTATR